ncbi:MAG: hypothetical protein ACLRM8_02120 [Alistipes sp.]
MAFWEEQDRLPEDVNLASPYCLTIVKNKCLNHLKVRLLHLQSEKAAFDPAAADPVRHSVIGGLRSRLAVRGGDAAMLDRAVSRMPELTRRIFEGSRYENKSKGLLRS